MRTVLLVLALGALVLATVPAGVTAQQRPGCDQGIDDVCAVWEEVEDTAWCVQNIRRCFGP